MNAVMHDSTPSPEDALAAARERRAEAAAKLEAASASLGRARTTATAAQAELDRREAEEREVIARHARRLEERARAGSDAPAPVLVPTDVAFLARRTAEVTSAAAQQALSALEASEREAADTHKHAEAAVMAAAREVLHAEIRAQFAEFRQLATEFASLREHLLAAFLGAGRAALTPREWLELDHLLGCPSSEMAIGSAWLDIPLNQQEQTGDRDRPREARARIDRLVGMFAARLEELAAGERQEIAA
jgi:hypothetical protein